LLEIAISSHTERIIPNAGLTKLKKKLKIIEQKKAEQERLNKTPQHNAPPISLLKKIALKCAANDNIKDGTLKLQLSENVPLNEADKLNGIEYHADYDFNYIYLDKDDGLWKSEGSRLEVKIRNSVLEATNGYYCVHTVNMNDKNYEIVNPDELKRDRETSLENKYQAIKDSVMSGKAFYTKKDLQQLSEEFKDSPVAMNGILNLPYMSEADKQYHINHQKNDEAFRNHMLNRANQN